MCLTAGVQILGTMDLATKQAYHWDKDEIQWLTLIGRNIGILISHVQLTDHLRDMTVLQERTRLAGEIHDGLAQLLGSLRLWAEEAQMSLDDRDMGSVKAAIKKIETTTQDAYANLREEILGLRDTIVPGKDFIPVITEYLSRYQRQWGIEARLHVGNLKDDHSRLDISTAAEIQLLRIIQEGLTNARRHANANSVILIIQEQEHIVQVTIQDDGRGFDPTKVSSDQLGLRIMRERAASVGGSIGIESDRGQGTTLHIEIPRRTS